MRKTNLLRKSHLFQKTDSAFYKPMIWVKIWKKINAKPENCVWLPQKYL